jgi:membrane fusion protein (multidrug efflux system)
MKRFILILILVALAACAKKEPAAAGAKEAPPLPADVQNVQGATNTASPATDTTSSSAGAAAASGVASEAGGAIVATGEFVSPVRSELSAKLPGRVGKVYVDEGSRVSRGEALLELETDYTRLNAARADAEVARAKAAEEDARRDLDRKKDLIAKDSIPKATYDRSESMFQQAQAARQSAVASASLLHQQVSDSVLRSPIDGVIAEKRTDVGQRLGDNTVAVVVVQTSPLKLRFRVPERELAQVHKGQSVKATVDPYPNETFEGKVTVVGGVIDSTTRSFLVETEFPNRDGRLRPGMFARVEMGAK